uniref:Uncharacterized protein n=1 Tax=Arundo donax TaxID=35708 RepID=A0A0A9ALS8_ARUDO
MPLLLDRTYLNLMVFLLTNETDLWLGT